MKLNPGPEMMSHETLTRRRTPSPVWTRPLMKIVGFESILSFKCQIAINKDYLQKETKIHSG